MDDFVGADLAERKASYSNNGFGIDVWAPADETLSAGTNGVVSYEDFVDLMMVFLIQILMDLITLMLILMVLLQQHL